MKPISQNPHIAPLVNPETIRLQSVTEYVSCQNPQKCIESFDAECIIYNGSDIICVDTVIVADGSNVAQAITGIVDWVCQDITSGVQGAQGTQGTQGPANGPQGATGNQGTQGVQGYIGAQGNTGTQGMNGAVAAQGMQGPQGSQGTQGLLGSQGLQGLIGLQGIQGNIGPNGIQGLQGIQGNQGTVGAQGIGGVQGYIGQTGAQGSVGLQGSIGATGSQGTAGSNGTQGATGTQGFTGIQGNVGTTGSNGSQGATGAQGPQGIQGLTGPSATLTAGTYVGKAVKNGTAQTIPNGVDTVVTLVDDFDPNNWFTSNQFKPNVAGYYLINAQVWWDAGVSTTNQSNIQLKKNGTTQVAIHQTQILSGAGYAQEINTIIYFNGTTDYVELTAFTGNTTSQNINGAATGTWLDAALYAYGVQGTQGTQGIQGITGAGTQGAQGVQGPAGSGGGGGGGRCSTDSTLIASTSGYFVSQGDGVTFIGSNELCGWNSCQWNDARECDRDTPHTSLTNTIPVSIDLALYDEIRICGSAIFDLYDPLTDDGEFMVGLGAIRCENDINNFTTRCLIDPTTNNQRFNISDYGYVCFDKTYIVETDPLGKCKDRLAVYLGMSDGAGTLPANIKFTFSLTAIKTCVDTYYDADPCCGGVPQLAYGTYIIGYTYVDSITGKCFTVVGYGSAGTPTVSLVSGVSYTDCVECTTVYPC